jgi:UPF0716 protein FxsA
MRRFLIILALLVIFPIIEISVLIAVGHVIGAAWTILLVLATSALGAWLLRHQGARSWRAFRADVTEGRPPGNTVTEGLLVLVGGVLMLVPGFVSDVMGGLLIAPPTRKLARVGVLALLGRRLTPDAATSLFGPRKIRVRTGTPQHPGQPADSTPWSATSAGPSSGVDPGPAIEGEIIDPR